MWEAEILSRTKRAAFIQNAKYDEQSAHVPSSHPSLDPCHSIKTKKGKLNYIVLALPTRSELT